jgi:hypothetical protein
MPSKRDERLSEASTGGKTVASSPLLSDWILTNVESDDDLAHKKASIKREEEDERPVFRRLLRQYETDEDEDADTKPLRQYEDARPLFSMPHHHTLQQMLILFF